MPSLNIKIHNLGDPPIFTECQPCIEGELVNAAVLEAGTARGATSLMLLIKMPDGSWVAAQTTAKILHMLDSAVRGAQERFGDLS